MDELTKILNEAGFRTVEGVEAVRSAILQEAGEDQTPLCSGYRVFPGGKKCEGCSDCLGWDVSKNGTGPLMGDY